MKINEKNREIPRILKAFRNGESQEYFNNIMEDF